MGWENGYGFVGGGGSGGAISTVLDVVQYTVGSAGGPVNGTTSFNPSPEILGDSVTVFVNGYGYLLNGVQFSFTTTGTYVTNITLLGGLQFNTGEIYTMTGYAT